MTTVEATPTKNSLEGERSPRYIPSIDGLRAISVIAVLIYHLNLTWWPGGFLGVDLFFVISGYVITRLILDSIERSSALDLKKFYRSRIRRLFPALIFMVIGTTLFIGVWAPETVRRFLQDLPFLFTATMNWALVAREQDYFSTIGRPPLLQHTWSLAVEIQFYLLWPLLLLAFLRFFGKRHIPKFALIFAIASGVLLFLYSVKIDAESQSSVSHVYFGSDTHTIGLFLGAALAVKWIPRNFTANIESGAKNFIDGFGIFAFGGLLTLFLFVNQSDPTLYRIAFPLTALFGCMTLMSLVHPASRISRWVTSAPMMWIGERSYGIYLWHWVVFQVTRPSVDLVGDQWALYALRFLIVFALADISYRWIEVPVRNGAIELWFKGLKYRTPAMRLRQQLLMIAGLVLTLAATATVSLSALDAEKQIKSELSASLNAQGSQKQTSGDTSALNNGTGEVASPHEKPGLWVTGDSVILGIRSQLEEYEPIDLINARVGRQINELIEVVGVDAKSVPKAITVLNLGNNGPVTEAQVRTLLGLLENQPHVIVVNAAVPRGWRESNNETIDLVLQDFSNATLIDWNRISKNHPEYFAPDGVHLVPTGANVYVSSILEVLERIGYRE
ncbi:MAG: acyltransferase [Actinobacteria bacterium]|nr:acyltransferase [Actinomycetota bacterium]